jgi:hypothetical protein
MRTIRTKVYLFNELNENAKENATNSNIEINVDFGWWQFTYEDAENIGLKIASFDLDRNRHAKGDFVLDSTQVAENILNEHGEICDTYLIASKYIQDYLKIDEDEENDEEREDLETEFLNELLEAYSVMLQNECEYLQSDKAISEALISNEYEFTKEGNSF